MAECRTILWASLVIIEAIFMIVSSILEQSETRHSTGVVLIGEGEREGSLVCEQKLQHALWLWRR